MRQKPTHISYLSFGKVKKEKRGGDEEEEDERRRRRGATPCRTHIDCEGGGGLSTSEARHAANQEK